MSLSEKAASNDIPLARSRYASAGLVFPLALVCAALVIILVSAMVSPEAFDAPAAEAFLVGP
jgi:hypothetical protein